MKDLIYEIEVDNPSRIEELPVSDNNSIELDYSHLDNEINEEEQEEIESNTIYDAELEDEDESDNYDDISEDDFEDTDL